MSDLENLVEIAAREGRDGARLILAIEQMDPDRRDEALREALGVLASPDSDAPYWTADWDV